ncbi:hypothetical protein [Marinospirillum insulare]|uniref:Uncharacterized protein n=1 Tax=Marinospirillum insulare TaxID=217169 RepID=A0ABQ5ZZU5_9GAMM|nr:hypothetical protein [Marinospirillum insulare]GLR65051.1 hypothetical protein GCM10007878_24900 [Marinospirillum insulare]
MSNESKEWTECVVLAERLPSNPEDLKLFIDQKATLDELKAVRQGVSDYIEILEKENLKFPH